MRRTAITITLILLLAGYAISKNSVDQREEQRSTNVDLRYLPTPQMAKFMALGFNQALADVYWIGGLNYFGEELGNKHRTYKYLSAYIDLILHLDPYFTFFYDWGSTAYIYNGLPITRKNLVKAIRLTNRGIRTLNKIERYDPSLIQKGAFNYALDASYYAPSVAYFELLGRSYPEYRDMLLVGSAYAVHSQSPALATSLREEYLAYKAFEAKDTTELRYAYNTVISSALTSRALDFIRTLRIQMEKDEDLRKLVAKELKENRVINEETKSQKKLAKVNTKFLKLLKVKIDDNWLPPELHLLFSL